MSRIKTVSAISSSVCAVAILFRRWVLATSSKKLYLSVLDVVSGEEVDRYRQAGGVGRVLWAQNGQKLVTIGRRIKRGDLNRIWVWDWHKDNSQMVPAGVYEINALAFSQDGKYDPACLDPESFFSGDPACWRT